MVPKSRLSKKAEYSVTTLYLFPPSSSGHHKEKETEGEWFSTEQESRGDSWSVITGMTEIIYRITASMKHV